jgi:hypothetical protein
MRFLLTVLCLLLSLCCQRQAAHRELHEGALQTAASAPKIAPDANGLVPVGPEMSFWDEFSGLGFTEIVNRYGAPDSLTTLDLNRANLVGTYKVLISRERIIKEKGGLVTVATWRQGEWEFCAFFWPASKICIGSIRWNTKCVQL